MVIKLGSIFYPAAITSYGYSDYFDGGAPNFIQVPAIESYAVANSPSYVLITSGPGVNAVGKVRTPITSTGYTDYLVVKNLIVQIDPPATASSYVNSVTFVLGTGKQVTPAVVTSTAVALFGAVSVKFNPVFIPSVLDIEISNRKQGELDAKQKVSTETIGGQEFNNSLNAYESLGGVIDNASTVKAKIVTKNVLDKSTSKDRRNIIKSFVNHYSNAGKRI